MIALSDQDDIWYPDRLAEAVKAFDNPALLLRHSDVLLIDAKGDPVGVSPI